MVGTVALLCVAIARRRVDGFIQQKKSRRHGTVEQMDG
jgi:hypothetical protein